ncbi:hypothetical protein L211DRAFT_853584 [Terfezia boudieri ATCC MYA-4762]|uniref:Uncharacterized protein n=1 Tax=Terfezia boudieri ATCC MYA-4762 TaxID=1051890 RepID=A0A3N4L7Y2_9PEZI|nr:hypothetical protein L211DRAFT_853584 [Terfezia boudieri ATCC MYA-4762]
MILKVTQWEIVKKGNKSRKTVRWQQDTVYEVDPEEVGDFSKHLTEQLRSAGVQAAQRDRDEEDYGSTTEEDIWGQIEDEGNEDSRGETNTRDDITREEEEEEEGKLIQCAQKEYQGTAGIRDWEEDD